jgi:hypothetical protein
VIFSLDDTRWREFSLWTTHAGEKLVDRLVASVARSACQKSVAARLASRGQKSANRLPHVASCYRAASSLSALLPCAALGIEMFLSALSMVLAASCRFHGSLLDAALSLSRAYMRSHQTLLIFSLLLHRRCALRAGGEDVNLICPFSALALYSKSVGPVRIGIKPADTALPHRIPRPRSRRCLALPGCPAIRASPPALPIAFWGRQQKCARTGAPQKVPANFGAQ